MTVSELGAYQVEYRAVDRGGNAEAVKSVTFWINRPTTVTGKVSAIAPSVLSLSVNPLAFNPFIAGVTQQILPPPKPAQSAALSQRR